MKFLGNIRKFLDNKKVVRSHDVQRRSLVKAFEEICVLIFQTLVDFEFTSLILLRIAKKSSFDFEQVKLLIVKN